MDLEYIANQMREEWDNMSTTAPDDDLMVSWRQRKEQLKTERFVKNKQTTNAWRRLRREAQEAAQNPHNLHDGWTVREGDRNA